MPNIFEKLFDVIKHFLTRPGMQDFLKKNIHDAIDRAEELIASKGGLGAIDLRDLDGELFTLLKAATGTDKDNWVVALKAFAIEAIKAAAPAPPPAPVEPPAPVG